jgi:hypothetical protein
MALDLRPLTLAELLDRSFSTYKRHLWLFAGIMAVPAIAATLYAVAMQAFNSSITPDMTPEQVLLRMVPLMIGAVVFMIVYFIVYAFALGATTIAVGELYKGQEVSVAEAYREVRRHGGRLILLLLWGTLRVGGTWLGLFTLTAIGSGLLATASRVASLIFMFGGFLATLVIGGYLAVRYGVSVAACSAGRS